MYLTIKLDKDNFDVIETGGDFLFKRDFDMNYITESLISNYGDYISLKGSNEKGGFRVTYNDNFYNVVFYERVDCIDFLLLDGGYDFEDLTSNDEDSLTGLYGKKKFLLDLSKVIEENSDVQVLLVDVDNFRRVNDKVGVNKGDKVIQEIVDRILLSLISDYTLYRYDEDCFGIIRLGGKEDRFLRQLMDVFENPFIIGDTRLYLSVSVGYVDYDYSKDYSEELEAMELVDKALVALYSSKDSGKGLYTVYSDSITERNYREMEIEGLIREALLENQFTLHYQPQYSMESKSIVGAEALIRWNHPELGLIPPNEFIPIAEKSGLIVQIGEWVVEEACRQQREWLDKGLGLVKVGVNIGSLHFKKSSFVDDVVKALDKYNLDYSHLGLEITEGSVIDDAEDMILKLEKLKDYGIHISIDDFGTGYSSLSYLNKFKIDTLKIDQSFVINMPEKNEDIAIVRAIIDLAKNLDIKVIAEGVENDKVKRLLMDMNCNDMQGYLFSKPVDKYEFERVLFEREEEIIF